jgi:MATE family multidrug resistance protein
MAYRVLDVYEVIMDGSYGPVNHRHRHLSTLATDDYIYEDYVETTIDPGNALFYIALFLSVASVAGVSQVVRLWRCFCPSRDPRISDTEVPENATTGDNMVLRRAIIAREITKEARASMLRLKVETACNIKDDSEAGGENGEVGLDNPQTPPSESIMRKEQRDICDEENSVDVPEILRLDDTRELTSTAREQQETHEKDNDVNCGERERKSPSMSFCSLDYLWTIVKYDTETHRLLRLVIPFTVSSVIQTASELITVAIIAQTLGTDPMIAYVMVQTITGISASFYGGLVEAVTTLSSMAYGAENHELAGMYVQAGCVLYIICEIPMVFIWRVAIGKILLLMGFDDIVVALAEEYVVVQVLIHIVMGMGESLRAFLQVIEREKFANLLFVVSNIVGVGLVALFAVQLEASLVALGLVILTNNGVLVILYAIIPSAMGWIREFEAGLFGNCACRDGSVVKDVFRVGLPLGFGSLLAYTEWEILTVFAAILGPAEAATWAIMGYVWDVFESTTEAVGDAAEVRVAYQLGRGRPAIAKLAGYKSMFLGLIFSIVVSVIFISLANVLPSWLTHDETIQDMLVEMFPLVALGNVTMSMGMVCWAIVGAQGRYHLSTSIAIACSFIVTIPIGLVVTIWMRIDLQGLTFAVVMGYSVTAMLLSALIVLSDWEMLSKKIQEQVAVDDLSDSSDDDSSSGSHSRKIQNAQNHDDDGPPKSQGQTDCLEVQPPNSPVSVFSFQS